MNLIAILSNIRIPDILDILLISIIAYQFYIWFWRTQAFKALLGIVVLSGIYIIADSWGLFLTTWAFQILWQVFVILLIILFQKEIRQVLILFNPLKTVGLRQKTHSDMWYAELAEWVFEAAKKKVGAVILFERKDLIFDLVTKGIALESDPKPEILWSVFSKKSPMHDGAVIISNGKILKASCFLPLTMREDLPKAWGTRHRAALGITEQCDAAALTISEERGEVGLIIGESHEIIDSAERLKERFGQILVEKTDTEQSDMNRVLSWFTNRYQAKAIIFIMVFVFWLGLAGQQDVEKKITIPLDYKNLSPGLAAIEENGQKVTITCRGLRKDISLLNQGNVTSFVDLSTAVPGTFSYYLENGNIKLPNDRIHLVHINPTRVEVGIKKSQ